jgi:hypothetical protein
MKSLSLRKKAQLAPKYVLQMEELNLFVAEKQGLTGCNLTENISEAMQYSVGFDNAEMKLGIWTATAKRMMNTDVKFNIVNL